MVIVLDINRYVSPTHGAREGTAYNPTTDIYEFLKAESLGDMFRLTTNIVLQGEIVRHGRYVTFQMAEVFVHQGLFAVILWCIDKLRPKRCHALRSEHRSTMNLK